MTDSHETPATYPDDTLAAALARHNFDIPAKQVKKINSYCQLLWEWNEKINLTRHTDYEKADRIVRGIAEKVERVRLERRRTGRQTRSDLDQEHCRVYGDHGPEGSTVGGTPPVGI